MDYHEVEERNRRELLLEVRSRNTRVELWLEVRSLLASVDPEVVLEQLESSSIISAVLAAQGWKRQKQEGPQPREKLRTLITESLPTKDLYTFRQAIRDIKARVQSEPASTLSADGHYSGIQTFTSIHGEQPRVYSREEARFYVIMFRQTAVSCYLSNAVALL